MNLQQNNQFTILSTYQLYLQHKDQKAKMCQKIMSLTKSKKHLQIEKISEKDHHFDERFEEASQNFDSLA